MKKGFDGLISYFCFGLLLFCATTVKAQQHPDFSGKWSIDVAKSKDLPWSSLQEYTMTVTQNEQIGKLTVRTRIHQLGGAPAERKEPKILPTPLREAIYTLDGSENTFNDPVAWTPLRVTQSAKWVGENLELRSQFDASNSGKKNVWTIVDQWESSKDGKLIVHQTIEWARGKQYATFVFNKQ